ncbi:hypothetical protein Tco_0529142 [Tanacetum coccineum]
MNLQSLRYNTLKSLFILVYDVSSTGLLCHSGLDTLVLKCYLCYDIGTQFQTQLFNSTFASDLRAYCDSDWDGDFVFVKSTTRSVEAHVTENEEKVRIYQKSQENRQKRANTDTGNGRAQEKPEKVKLQSKVVKKSKKVNSQSTSVNYGSTKSTH